MMKFLGTIAGALAALWATQAHAIITFQSIGPEPVIERNFTPSLATRPGSFGIETITPAGQANVVVQFTRESWMIAPKYDYLDALAALGDLQGILTFEGQPASYMTHKNSLSVGKLTILYAGPTFTANGHTYATGSTLLYTRFRQSDPYGPYVSSSFADTGAGISSVGIHYLNPTTDGYVVRSGLAGGVSFAVPEPATWAMMIIGFGLTGSAVRQSRKKPLGLA